MPPSSSSRILGCDLKRWNSCAVVVGGGGVGVGVGGGGSLFCFFVLEEGKRRERVSFLLWVFLSFSLALFSPPPSPPQKKKKPATRLVRVERRVLVVESHDEPQRDAARLRRCCCCRRRRRSRRSLSRVGRRSVAAGLAFFALAPAPFPVLLLLFAHVIEEPAAVGVRGQREPHGVPRGPRRVLLGGHRPDLLEAQGIGLRLRSRAALGASSSASPLFPEPKLPLGLLRQGPARALGEQRRPRPHLDAARERAAAAVGGAVLGDSDVPRHDPGHGLLGVSPVFFEQKRRGGKAREHVDPRLLGLVAQIPHQLPEREHPPLALFVVHLRRRREPPGRLFREVEETVGGDGDPRGGAGLRVGRRPVLSQELGEGARVDSGPGEGVRSQGRALLEDGDGEVDVGGGGALSFLFVCLEEREDKGG